jgi:hypothetical protein
MEVVSFLINKFPASLRNELKVYCAINNITMAVAAIEAIRMYLDNKK